MQEKLYYYNFTFAKYGIKRDKRKSKKFSMQQQFE